MGPVGISVEMGASAGLDPAAQSTAEEIEDPCGEGHAPANQSGTDGVLR